MINGRSLCVTSQLGCNMGCRFCASGLLKKQRNLTAGEMVNQILTVMNDTKERVSHVVVMGTGEPFDNYDHVMNFIRIINHPKGLGYWGKTFNNFNMWIMQIRLKCMHMKEFKVI